MDEGRRHDLKQLEKIINDRETDDFTRSQAIQSRKKIIKQLEDKKLTKLRQSLIEASRANDHEATACYERQIVIHSYEQGYSDTPPDPEVWVLPGGVTIYYQYTRKDR